MQDFVPQSVTVRPFIGTRKIGGKLCLINQGEREVWVCGGSSAKIWEQLSQGKAIHDIAFELASAYRVPFEKIEKDVSRFAVQLAERGLVDVIDINAVRTAIPRSKEIAHNQTGLLYQEALKANVLFRVWLDLLIPCNLRCRHCYLDFSETKVVPLEEMKDRINQLSDHGCPELVLTGGEIFLRRDLLEIIAHTESKGFLFDLYTNGNFIDEKMADRLAKYRITTVQISVYGTNAQVHETITRKAGTFDKSTRAARLLIERGIPVRLQCHIQQDNFEDAFRFPEFARSLGATHGFDTKLVPNRDGSKELLSYGVTVQQQAELYSSGLLKRETKFVCTAAASKARINAHGEIYPCELINTATVGDLRRNTLAEIWSSKFRSDLRQQILGYTPHRCGGCNHKMHCEPCAAMRGFGQEGHMEAPISEACLLTTASLLSSGKGIHDTPAGFQQFADDCVQQTLASQRSGRAGSQLVQILQARIPAPSGAN
jgi:radical SAM protein with 4Fe4S-binding SPASM domain